MSFLKKNKIFILLGVIMLGGLFLRLVPLSNFYTLEPETQAEMVFSGDAKGYYSFAQIFKNSGTFSVFDKINDVKIHSTIPSITTFRVPFYPYFLSIFFRLFDNKTSPVFLAQSILDIGTIGLIFCITLILFKKEWMALLAATLYAISPLAIMYTTSLFADNLFTFFFTVLLLLLVLLFKKYSHRRMLAVGFALGILSLIKPIGTYFLPIILFSLLFSLPNLKLEWKKYTLGTLLLVITFFITISPWQIRNLIIAGHYSLTWQQGRDLLVFRQGTCEAWTNGISRKNYWAKIQRPFVKIKDPFERSVQEQKEFEKYALNNIGELSLCTMTGLRRFFVSKDIFAVAGGNEYSQNEYQFASNGVTNTFLHSFASRQFWIDASYWYAYLLYFEYLTIIVGSTLLLIKKQNRAAIILFLLTIVYLALLSGVDGYARYRYPLTPIIAILMASSLFVIAEYLIKYSKLLIQKYHK